MDKTADVLFGYLRDVLYEPASARLDPAALPEDFRALGEGLVYFGRCLIEAREFSWALSKGNLGVKPPPPDNELAAPLKALQASLKHLTWQSQQVAKGDYQQRVDFMGDFADAFNTMIQQLDHRQKALEAEIASGRRKTRALEQSSSLFAAITERIPQIIIVVNRDDGSRLFVNQMADRVLADDERQGSPITQWIGQHLARLGASDNGAGADGTLELVLPADDGLRYYAVSTYPIHWHQRSALAFIMGDVSSEKRHVKQLESYAYQDNLTKVHNRFFGMQTLRDWLDEGRAFCIGFADLDSLKYVNDTYGHTEGDRYIIAAARAMVENLPQGVVCRLGGDEFMVLIPGCGQAEGEALLDAIRGQLAASNPDSVTLYERSFSYGVVAVPGGPDAPSGSELLSQADERMYAYKRAHKKARRL